MVAHTFGLLVQDCESTWAQRSHERVHKQRPNVQRVTCTTVEVEEECLWQTLHKDLNIGLMPSSSNFAKGGARLSSLLVNVARFGQR